MTHSGTLAHAKQLLTNMTGYTPWVPVLALHWRGVTVAEVPGPLEFNLLPPPTPPGDPMT